MKKFFALFLALILAFSLIGCGGTNLKKDALQAIKTATSAQLPGTDGNAQYDFDFVLDMTMTLNETPLNFGFSGNMKAIFQNNAMSQMLFVGEMNMAGMGTFDTVMFLGSDGKFYSSTMGMTSEIPAESATQFDNLLMTDDSLTEDLIKSAEVTENADGSTTYVIVVDGQALANSEALKDQLSQGNLDGSYDIGDVTYTITIGEDGKPMKAELALEMNVIAEGESSSVVMNVEITYNSFENVVIDTSPYEN